MKKILLMLIIIASIPNSTFSQSIENPRKNPIKYPPYGLRVYNAYNKEATDYQYRAIGCATVSAGLLIGFGCIKDRYYINDNGKYKMNTKSKALVIGGSVFAALAIFSELHVIRCKIEARKGFGIYLNENVAKLSYTF